MLVSSVGYFNNSVKYSLNSVESNKKHHVVNEGLKEQFENSSNTGNVFKEFITNIKLIFSNKNKDCSSALNMIA